jgi:RNA polymerase sigma factor (sigma-70 family)
MSGQELIPHLFRTEFRKIVSVLVKHFGFQQMESAEDIASDTFLTAAQTWPLTGLPENPVAWLYYVAKNKAKNFLQREHLYENKIVPVVKHASPEVDESDINLSPEHITDSVLSMMFAICQPAITTEAQVGLSLRILCGFGIDEIADAFLTSKDTINKRLMRARQKLREANIQLEIPAANEIDARLDAVLMTIYLLFNEGYYSASANSILRKDLCLEAMHLCHMLIENKQTNKLKVNALLALMCFHASRFEARVGENGEMVLYDDQDSSLWNTELISKGAYFFKLAAAGNHVSSYHLEAGIAYWYTQRYDTTEKWENILQLHNHLLQLQYSPIVALNRTYALAKARGKDEAIAQAERLKLSDNHFYFTLLGELYAGVDQEKAIVNFRKALALARTVAEKRVIEKKINTLSV